MNTFLYGVYNLLIRASIPAAGIFSLFDGKVREGIAGRTGFRRRWTDFARNLPRNKPLAWFHVSSAGEFEQALPVMEMLSAKLNGELTVVLTFFSPSGLNFYRRHRAAKVGSVEPFVDYLPFDLRGNMVFCLETLRPDVIVYTRYDVWPNLAREAGRMGIPQVLISASITPSSRLFLPLARSFFSSVYSNLSAIAAISAEDTLQYERLIKDAGRISIAGDTRFDRVWERATSATYTPPEPLLRCGKKMILCGSTWPPDERLVIEGFSSMKEKLGDVIIVLVPHEPTEKRISEIIEELSTNRLTHCLYSSLTTTDEIKCDCIVVDGVGFLAELYRYATVAYVGGAFTTGVHSVLEPAVMGVPVLFGPRYENSREAVRLIEFGGAVSVGGVDQLTTELSALLADEGKRAEKGRKAKKFVEENLGATARSVEIILKYLEN